MFLLYLQTRPDYSGKQEKCVIGCGQTYRETPHEHFQVFHAPKTEAFMCGCGFGDIMANRFRIHLERSHGVKFDEEYIADEFYFHDLPVFTSLRTCSNEKYKGTCKYRTPYNLLLREHDCINDIKFSELPDAHAFYDKLPKEQWPIWGYPHEDRLKSAKKKNNNDSTTKNKEPTKEAPKVKSQVHVPEKKTTTPPTTHVATTSSTKHAASDDDILDEGEQPELLEGLPPTMQTTDKDDEDETCVMTVGGEKESLPEAEMMEVESTKTDEKAHDKPAAGSPKEQRGEKRLHRKDSKEKMTGSKALEEQALRDDVATKLTRANYTGPTRQPFTPNIDMIRQVRVLPMRDGRSPYVDYKDQNRLPTHYCQAGLLQYHEELNAPGTIHRVVFQVPLTCGRFFVLGEEGVPVAYATVTLHWSSAYLQDHDSRVCQYNPSQLGAVAEVYDTRTRPATMSHFVCLSHRLNQGRYALVPAPLEGKHTTIYMDVCHGTSDFGLPSPIKWLDDHKK